MAGPHRFYNARRSCASTGTPVRHKREKTMGTGSWTAVAAPASTALVFYIIGRLYELRSATKSTFSHYCGICGRHGCTHPRRGSYPGPGPNPHRHLQLPWRL